MNAVVKLNYQIHKTELHFKSFSKSSEILLHNLLMDQSFLKLPSTKPTFHKS